MEQDTGVEPAFTAWEAVVLPIYESCVSKGIIAKGHGNFNPFLSKVSGAATAAPALFTRILLPDATSCPAGM